MPRFPSLAGLVWACLGLSTLGNTPANPPPAGDGLELSFIQGDTRKGTQVKVRILGDSIYFRRTIYSPGATLQILDETAPLDVQRQRTLNGVLGELPRYPSFGSCYGKGMRYYLVETGKGRFYRSVPEHAGKCYLDEPGIFSLFEDIDDLLAPLAPPEPDASAS